MLTSKSFSRLSILSVAAALVIGATATASTSVFTQNVASNRRSLTSMLGNTFDRTRFAEVEKDTFGINVVPFAFIPKHNLHSTCIKADAGVPSIGTDLQVSYKNPEGFYGSINAPIMMTPKNLNVAQARLNQSLTDDVHPRLLTSLRNDGVALGINDINARIGYTLFNNDLVTVDMFVNGKLPMGAQADELATWKTIIGSRHVSLGAGFGAECRVFETGDFKALAQGEVSYNYDARRSNKNVSINLRETTDGQTIISAKNLGNVHVSPGHNLNGQLVGILSWKFIDCQVGGSLDFNTIPHFYKEVTRLVTTSTEGDIAAATEVRKKDLQALNDVRNTIDFARINHSLHAMVRVNARDVIASSWFAPVSFGIGAHVQNAKYASLVSNIGLTF